MHLKRRLVCPPGVSALNAFNDSTWQRHLAEKIFVLSALFYLINNLEDIVVFLGLKMFIMIIPG